MAQISLRHLAELLRRVGTSLRAGLDPVRIWQRESSSLPTPGLRQAAAQVALQLGQGQAMHQALRSQRLFPELVVELIQVGEESGHLAEVCLQLADHYDTVLKVRRAFLAAITWPVLELAAALGVVGFLILIIGMFDLPDILGLGLRGPGGCMIYLGVLVGGFLLGWGLWRWARRGPAWARALGDLLARVPGLGRFLELLALSRLAWALSLVLNTNMDLRRAVPLALKATGRHRYFKQSSSVVQAIEQGRSLTEALQATGVFPADFLDVVAVGEQSGQLPESMAQLAQTYNDQVHRMMHIIGTIGAFVVMVVVGLVIIGMIWALISHTLLPYYRQIQELSQP